MGMVAWAAALDVVKESAAYQEAWRVRREWEHRYEAAMCLHKDDYWQARRTNSPDAEQIRLAYDAAALSFEKENPEPPRPWHEDWLIDAVRDERIGMYSAKNTSIRLSWHDKWERDNVAFLESEASKAFPLAGGGLRDPSVPVVGGEREDAASAPEADRQRTEQATPESKAPPAPGPGSGASSNKASAGNAAKKRRGRPVGGYFEDLKALVHIPEVRNALIGMDGRDQATAIRRQWPIRGYGSTLPAKSPDDTNLRNAIKKALAETEGVS